MREIKFRAWNGKEMIRPYSVRNGFAMVIKECSKDDKVLTDSDGKNYYSNWDIDVGTDYPLMQFTGLTDKNGVDIYEGDILLARINETTTVVPKKGIKSLDRYEPKKGEKFLTGNKVGEVWTIEHVNHTTYSGYKFYGKNRRFNIPATRSSVSNNEVKIIGNIHQNPELLESK